MPDEDVVTVSEAGALAEVFERLYDEHIIHLKVWDTDREAVLAALPAGRTVESLKPLMDQFRERPERIEGTAQLGDLASFVAHAKAFAATGAAIFASADRREPSLTAVYDYHIPAIPGWCRHRARYACPLSDEWRAWQAMDGKPLNQADFAAFLEDRIADVVVPPDDPGELGDFLELIGGHFATPQRLVELSRGLQVNADVRVKNAVTLSSGEVQLAYDEVHQDGTGQPIKVPNLFLLGIPVFRSGPLYRIPVRLRYRLREQKLSWFYNLYRADKVFDHAFEEVVVEARSTGIPVFVGAPEA